jgi:hypothetical protein
MKKHKCKIGFVLTIILNLSFNLLLPAKVSKAMARELGSLTDDSETFIYSPAQKKNIPVRDVRDGISEISKSAPYSSAEQRPFRQNKETTTAARPFTIGAYDPATSTFKLRNSNTSGPSDITVTFGLPGDKPIVGDWNGDGIRTIGTYRNSDGTFHLSNSNANPHEDIVFTWGGPPYQYQPIAGDWNGDGIDTVGLFHEGGFFLRNSNTAGPAEVYFGLGGPGDVAITGDWNGDGLDTCGVFRPSNGALYLKNSNNTGFADIAITYGSPGDKPVTGDWDGDGVDTIGVYRGDTVFLRNSNTSGFGDIVFTFGASGYEPIAGNWALPIPGGFGSGNVFNSSFETAWSDRAEIGYDILCPTWAGGNNSHSLYLTATNRASLGVEALVDYESQEPFRFRVFDWARPESERWQTDLPYSYLLSDYLTTITVGGSNYQALTVYNSTRRIAVAEAPNTLWTWTNSVLLLNYSLGYYDLIYSYTYHATEAEQRTGRTNNFHINNWGPIVECFQPSYSNLNPMGFNNCITRSHPDQFGDLRLTPSQAEFSEPERSAIQGMHLLYLEPNYTFTIH